MANRTVMLNIDREVYEAHQLYFDPLKSGENGRPDPATVQEAADLASDWQFFRFCEGAVNTGMTEAKYGVSETLGVIRPLTISEAHSLNSCDPEFFEKNKAEYDRAAAGLESHKARHNAVQNFSNFLRESDIDGGSDAAVAMRKSCGACGKTENLRILNKIMIDGIPPEDIFVSRRDQALMRSPRGVTVLADEIERHADEERLSFVRFGDQRVALMFISPEPDGFEGRVRRELSRDLPEQEADDLAKLASPIEDEDTFLHMVKDARRSARLEAIIERAPEPEIDTDAEMSF
ncbi:MAG: hypothetical protein ABJN42_28995 [Roseibium sp.]|uniref:hypothetical protein n=1 Tax=Roseibium sp. TaxID=1936156 RepID=UPI0032990BB0